MLPPPLYVPISRIVGLGMVETRLLKIYFSMGWSCDSIVFICFWIGNVSIIHGVPYAKEGCFRSCRHHFSAELSGDPIRTRPFLTRPFFA